MIKFNETSSFPEPLLTIDEKGNYGGKYANKGKEWCDGFVEGWTQHQQQYYKQHCTEISDNGN